MAKQLRKKSRRQKYKSHRRQTKKMVGGDFTNADRTELGTIGFNNNDIALLEEHMPIMNLIRTSLAQINPQTGNPFTPQELIQDLQNTLNEEPNDDNDELNISGISNISGDYDVDLNESFDCQLKSFFQKEILVISFGYYKKNSHLGCRYRIQNFLKPEFAFSLKPVLLFL